MAFARGGPTWIEINGSFQQEVEDENGDTVLLTFSASAPYKRTPAERAAYGWVEIVEPSDDIPPGAEQIGEQLVDEGGLPTRKRIFAPISLAAIKEAMIAQVDGLYETHRQEPFSWDFGDIEALDDFGESLGAAGLQTLQMRDDGVKDDVKNWLGVMTAVSLALMSGGGAVPRPLKTTANAWVQTTSAQAAAVLVAGDGTQDSMLRRTEKVLQRSGELKQSINAATTVGELNAIDVTLGWPA